MANATRAERIARNANAEPIRRADLPAPERKRLRSLEAEGMAAATAQGHAMFDRPRFNAHKPARVWLARCSNEGCYAALLVSPDRVPGYGGSAITGACRAPNTAPARTDADAEEEEDTTMPKDDSSSSPGTEPLRTELQVAFDGPSAVVKPPRRKRSAVSVPPPLAVAIDKANEAAATSETPVPAPAPKARRPRAAKAAPAPTAPPAPPTESTPVSEPTTVASTEETPATEESQMKQQTKNQKQTSSASKSGDVINRSKVDAVKERVRAAKHTKKGKSQRAGDGPSRRDLILKVLTQAKHGLCYQCQFKRSGLPENCMGFGAATNALIAEKQVKRDRSICGDCQNVRTVSALVGVKLPVPEKPAKGSSKQSKASKGTRKASASRKK
jgi:hypothetical protein